MINAFALNSVCLKADTPKPKTFNHINEVRMHLRLEEEMKKLLILLAVGAIVVPVLVFSESSVTPPIPHLINYQGMLTDDSGTPLNDTPDITFEIWNAPSGGTRRWWETQSNVSVVNGLFNVILGNVNPINLSFYQDENYWLQIIVEEDTMPSRLKFTSVAFAYRAQKSDTAAYAISGGSYSHNHDADYVNVNGPDSVRGSSAGYMFQVKNYGTNDGIYIYTPAAGGDGIYIDSAGDYGVEIHDVGSAGVYVDDAGLAGIWVNDCYGYGIYLQDVEDDGINIFDAANNGLHVQLADYGVYVDSTRSGYDGIYVHYAEDDGMTVSHADDEGVYVVEAGGSGVWAHGNQGNSLYGESDGWYGLYVHSNGSASNKPGIYIYGNGHITGSWSKSVKGTSGDVSAFGVFSPDVELITSGTGTLVNGQAQITFEREFQEAISSEVPVRVVVTAQGAPSALLYVDSKSTQGFAVKSLAIPELSLKTDNVSFDWIAIARQKGYEQRPEVLIPSEEERRAEELKEQEELQRNALYHQQMHEKQARREAERKEREKEEGSTD